MIKKLKVEKSLSMSIMGHKVGYNAGTYKAEPQSVTQL